MKKVKLNLPHLLLPTELVDRKKSLIGQNCNKSDNHICVPSASKKKYPIRQVCNHYKFQNVVFLSGTLSGFELSFTGTKPLKMLFLHDLVRHNRFLFGKICGKKILLNGRNV